MKLRTRLVVAFLLLSVVPLGAVTFYSYTSNVNALKVAAGHEADLLASELRQRMQLVTAQLTERVEHLIEMPQAESIVAADTTTPPATTQKTTTPIAPAPAVAAGPDVDENLLRVDVANRLGEMAVMLNSVELPGYMRGGRSGRPPRQADQPPDMRGGGSGGGGGGRGGNNRGGPPPPNVTTIGPRQTPASAQATPTPTQTPTASPTPTLSSITPAQSTSPTPSTPSATPTMGFDPNRGKGPRMPGGFDMPPQQRQRPGGQGANAIADPARGVTGAPVPPPMPVPPNAPQTAISMQSSGKGDRLMISAAPIFREIYLQIIPESQKTPATAEQLQRVQSEVAQRLAGIREGLKLSASQLAKQADEERIKADEQIKTAAAANNKKAAAVAPKPSPVPKPAAREVLVAATGPTTTRTALKGNRLEVTTEQNGKVIRSVNAEINVPNLMLTLFSAIGREKGEVPFAVAPDGKIYTSSDTDQKKVEALGAVARPDGKLGTTFQDDSIVVTTEDPSGSGLRFGVARPVADSLADLRKTAGRNAGLGLLLIGLAIAGVVPLSARLTRNLSTLTEGVGRIAHGDYSARVAVKSKDEIGELAHAFNQMASDVEQHQRAVVGQERLKRELELGRQIQHDMLPHEPLMFGLTEIQGVSVPAREVGGDFFNYFGLPGGLVALLVGDVSGKGVGAALLMANIQASLRTRFALGQDLSAIANAIDNDFQASSPGSMYATLFMGILDPASRKLRYVNAGHHPQFVLRGDGTIEQMWSTGMPVGLLAGHGYREREVQLSAGDLVFFYTDGCVETESETGDMFGSERLEKHLLSAGPGSSASVLQHVERALQEFRGARELYDDATMMAVRVG